MLEQRLYCGVDGAVGCVDELYAVAVASEAAVAQLRRYVVFAVVR